MTDTPPPIRTGVIGGPLWRTLPVGRDGGNKTIESVCPDNLVLKGIEGTGSDLPLSMKPKCADPRKIAEETPSLPAPIVDGSPIIFAPSAQVMSASCPTNEVVVGARSRFDEFLNQLILTCIRIDANKIIVPATPSTDA